MAIMLRVWGSSTRLMLFDGIIRSTSRSRRTSPALKARTKSARSPILKCAARSIRLIRYRPAAPPAPRNRIRANADNRKASRTSLFERLGSQGRLRGSLRGEDEATVLLINTYRTPVSGILRRKDSGFAVCGENLASVSRFVAGIRHSSRMLRSLCKNERQLMSQKETLLRSAQASCATRAQQLERTAAFIALRSGRREPQRSVSGGGQDRLKRSLMNSGSHPEAVLGPGAIARYSTTTRRSTSPFR